MGGLAESGLLPKRLLVCSCRSALLRTSPAFRPPGHADMQAGSSQSCCSSFSTISTAAAPTEPGCSQLLPGTRVRTQLGGQGERGADRTKLWAGPTLSKPLWSRHAGLQTRATPSRHQQSAPGQLESCQES